MNVRSVTQQGLTKLLATVLTCIFCVAPASALPTADIVFVGQIPNSTDFATANASFGNHLATVESIVRGGDLFIRYRNGTVKNLTRAAGYGHSGFQGADAIAVRDPSVSWDGRKVLFSMVVGAPSELYQQKEFRWQLYEMTGLGEQETPVVKKVPFQPDSFNNISPVYAPDDSVIFTSDRPRNGATHLYPQRDEYESQPTNTGIWSLDMTSGDLRLLDHAPSGAFEPIVDSFGRIVYSRWDHLQRDQQADGDGSYGPLNFSSEKLSSTPLPQASELFPEPRVRSLITDNRTNPHSFNHFFPWMINPDGSGHETLNHIGRHELHGYFDRSFSDDENLEEHYGEQGESYQREIQNFLHVHEDPRSSGLYYAIDAPEFGTHAAGQVITLQGEPSRNGDQMPVAYVTDRSTAQVDPDNLAPTHTGLYRDPLPLSDGTVIVSHTSTKLADSNMGSEEHPVSRYSFRLKALVQNGSTWQAGTPLTTGIQASVQYYTPDVVASYSGVLWELQPVEVVARPRPIPRATVIEPPEAEIFQSAGVNVDELRRSLAQRNLALIIVRNITSRDQADRQQPFNIRVPDGGAESVRVAGKVYTAAFLQLFQGDQLRGYGSSSGLEAGRRVIAHPLHDGMIANPFIEGAPPSSVQVASDGSVAAIVPARRALTWQVTDPQGEPVVRERYWLTFQPGEIRLCAGCHGANSRDQMGRAAPTNSPKALRALLEYLRNNPLPDNGEDDGEDVARKKYSLVLRGSRKDVLESGQRAILQVSVAPAARERVSIRLAVDGQRCRNNIAVVTTSTAGTRRIQGRIPVMGGHGARLYFTLLRKGVAVAEAKSALSSRLRHGRARQPLSSQDVRTICRGFASLR